MAIPCLWLLYGVAGMEVEGLWRWKGRVDA
jgi:hypothetical protein